MIADDVEQTAAQAYGVTGYPFLTFIDADGNVVARTSGELPVETLQALADATVVRLTVVLHAATRRATGVSARRAGPPGGR